MIRPVEWRAELIEEVFDFIKHRSRSRPRDNPTMRKHGRAWLMLGYLGRNENPPGLSPAGPGELLCQKGSRNSDTYSRSWKRTEIKLTVCYRLSLLQVRKRYVVDKFGHILSWI